MSGHGASPQTFKAHSDLGPFAQPKPPPPVVNSWVPAALPAPEPLPPPPPPAAAPEDVAKAVFPQPPAKTPPKCQPQASIPGPPAEKTAPPQAAITAEPKALRETVTDLQAELTRMREEMAGMRHTLRTAFPGLA